MRRPSASFTSAIILAAACTMLFAGRGACDIQRSGGSIAVQGGIHAGFSTPATRTTRIAEDHSHVTSPSEKVVDFEWYARTRIRKDKKDHRVMDLIVGLTLLGSILFLGCGTGCTLLCLLCLQRRRRQSRPQDQQAVARPPGLNRQEIELFPLTIYVATAGDASEDNVEEESACVICHDSYSPGQSMRTLTCSHSYHSECIDKWLSIHRTCPECRHEYP